MALKESITSSILSVLLCSTLVMWCNGCDVLNCDAGDRRHGGYGDSPWKRVVQAGGCGCGAGRGEDAMLCYAMLCYAML